MKSLMPKDFREANIVEKKRSFTVVFKLGGKRIGRKATNDRKEAERWKSGWTAYGILPYGTPSFGAPGICSKCGRRTYLSACSGCGWSVGLCKCDPLNKVEACPACGRDLPVVATYCPYCGAKLKDDEDFGVHPMMAVRAPVEVR